MYSPFLALNKLFMMRCALLSYRMLEAKCHKCNKSAQVNDDMTMVSCPNCLSEISYEEYLEIMKNRAINMGFDYQGNFNRNKFS